MVWLWMFLLLSLSLFLSRSVHIPNVFPQLFNDPVRTFIVKHFDIAKLQVIYVWMNEHRNYNTETEQ